MKLFASDYDGTLCFHDRKECPDGYYKEEDVAGIIKWQARGNLFGICTGRSLSSIMEAVKRQNKFQPDFYIASSGAVIADQNGEILFARYLDYDLLKEIYQKTKGKNMFIAHSKGYVPLSDSVPSFMEKEQKERVRSIEEFRQEKIETASFEYESEEELGKGLKAIKEYESKLSLFVNVTSIDLVAKGCSKGEGLLKAVQLFGAAPENASCMGDSYNDLPMLKSIEHSFTFPDAPEELKNTCEACMKTVASALSVLNG